MSKNKKDTAKYEVNYLNNLIGIGDGKLKGFLVTKEVPEARPAIALDNFNRIYFNADARDALELTPQMRMIVAYNPDSKMFAIIKSSDMDLHGEYVTSIDKRFYANIKYLADCFRLNGGNKGPKYYDYIGRDSAGNAYLFKLRE